MLGRYWAEVEVSGIDMYVTRLDIVKAMSVSKTWHTFVVKEISSGATWNFAAPTWHPVAEGIHGFLT